MAAKGHINPDMMTAIWETALATKWQGSPVWVHGDISMDNLLVESGKLSAVIDFGCLGIGDPSCGLTIAWTFFNEESRRAFCQTLQLDEAAWARGRGWTLWKALITWAEIPSASHAKADRFRRIIDEVVTDYRQTL